MSDTTFDKSPAHDANAEYGVLAAFMCDDTGDVRREIIALLPDARAFFDEGNATIYRVFLALHRDQRLEDGKLDPIVICSELRKLDATEELMIAVREAASAGFIVAAGRHYASIVREHYWRRWQWQESQAWGASVWPMDSDPLALAMRQRDRLNEFIIRANGYGRRAGGSAELLQLIDQTRSGDRRALNFRGMFLSQLTKALLPATITVVSGTPGDGKTFWLLDSMIGWREEQITCAAFMLEGKRKDHLNRCLGILAEDCRVLDDDQVRSGTVPMDQYISDHRAALEDLGACLFDTTHIEPSLEQIAVWIEQQSRDKRVLIVDPITLATAKQDRWLADEQFMRSARNSIERTGASLIVVTHPRSGNKKADQDDIAGGQIYKRAAECVMVLKKLDDREYFRVDDGRFTQTMSANRIMRIIKARHGKGGGSRIAMDFTFGNLKFHEFGVIERAATATEEEKSVK